MHGYRADRAFDGEKELPGGALVLIEGGRIIGVEPAGAPVPDGCEVTYEPGTTVLPGLIDAHVHLCADAGPNALDRIPGFSPDELNAVIEESMRIHLHTGVTTVRDLGDHEWAVVDGFRDWPGGPTVVASGPPITSIGGHCASMGGEASGVDELRAAVRERVERGADLVKIMTSGGVMTPGTDILSCQFSDDELQAVVDEAHALGLPVTAHAHGVPSVRQSIAAGVDSIEHCSCLVPNGVNTPADIIEGLVTNDIVVCPTIGADLQATGGVLPPQIAAMMERTGITLEMRAAQVSELVAGGVRLISGGDSGISPAKHHALLPISIGNLVDCGLAPAAALTTATTGGAKAIGLGDRTGSLRAGLDADLLIVGGNPLDDITALHDVRTVVSHGRLIEL
jgi:imidazolonepropionase-like amidohydrolase